MALFEEEWEEYAAAHPDKDLAGRKDAFYHGAAAMFKISLASSYDEPLTQAERGAVLMRIAEEINQYLVQKIAELDKKMRH